VVHPANWQLESPAKTANAVPTAEGALACADTTAAEAVDAVPTAEAVPTGAGASAAALTAAAPAATVKVTAPISGRHSLVDYGYRCAGDRRRLHRNNRASRRRGCDGYRDAARRQHE
jgi:hypothetical protein